MKNMRLLIALCLFLAATAVSARADLNIFLGDLNNRAAASPNDYHNRLSTQFGVPQSQIHTLTRSVAAPADAFMVLQLAQMLGLSHERVLRTYNANQGKGWGVISKELGIKPGSAEFHALKNGNFSFTGVPGGKAHGKNKGSGNDNKENIYGSDQGKPGKGQDVEMTGQGKGKGKGHNK
jgi:hypothetical protein